MSGPRMVRCAVALVAAIATIAVAAAGVASAHSGLGAASPAPGSTVGGEITEIQLRYSSAVDDPDGSVVDPTGEPIGTTWVQETSLAVRVLLAAPLSTPGEYTVRWDGSNSARTAVAGPQITQFVSSWSSNSAELTIEVGDLRWINPSPLVWKAA